MTWNCLSTYTQHEIPPTGTYRRLSLNTLLRGFVVFLVIVFLFQVLRIVSRSIYYTQSAIRHDQMRTFRKNCTYTTETGTFDVSQLPERLRSHNFPFPKVIHRTWKDLEVPERWNEGVISCQEKNFGFGYCHWTDTELEDFIRELYPWFLETYRNYAYDIQRIDAVRYFMLLHYGGIYLDLDYTCKVPLEVALATYSDFEVVLAETVPIGVTNGFMSSASGLPFWQYVVENLADADRWYVVPYATIMFSTGPMYLTLRLDSYQRKGLPGRIAVIPKEVLADEILGHLVGNSWHRWDANIALFSYRWRYVLCPLATAVAVILLAFLLVWCFRRRRRRHFGKG